MLPKVKEKLNQQQNCQQQKQQQPLLQKDDIKCRELIGNFKKSIELWFINGADDEITFGVIRDTCIEIILHGLHDAHVMLQINNKDKTTINVSPSSSSTTASCGTDTYLNVLLKRIDDFEWILNVIKIRNNVVYTKYLDVASTPPSTSFNCSDEAFTIPTSTPHKKFQRNSLSRQLQNNDTTNNPSLFKEWLKLNLRQSTTLCSFLQYLVADKELLDEHYSSQALLRQEKYVSALVIGLIALETYQYGLLTQIDAILKKSDYKVTEHKRSNSQPNVWVLPPIKRTRFKQVSTPPNTIVLPCIRKTKSLPEFKTECENANDTMDGPRRRCKTLVGIKRKYTRKQNIPRGGGDVNIRQSLRPPVTTTSGSSSYDDNQKPSTSQNSNTNRQRCGSNSPMSSECFNSTASITSNNSTSTLSVCSSNSNTTTACRIQLINTDDIKIWTDQSWDSRKKSLSSPTTTPRVIPKSSNRPTSTSSTSLNKSSKSVSPLNNFFASLFSTPPSYTSWYTDHNSREEDEEPETAVEYITSDNQSANRTKGTNQSHNSTTASTTVFDKFLPINGKKLQTRNSQNLFDDIISTSIEALNGNNITTSSSSEIAKEESKSSTNDTTKPAKNCQSLRQFLQMSNLSRNNTELEKENAHFQISEAIISAIEHIKWNKQEPLDNKISKEGTPLGTDYLSSSSQAHTANVRKSNECFKGGEHVPYAEEVISEPLSAEVVGLSLIAKFEEKHLPKMSELKWLVSDDDTKQKLLPMPDLTSSENPDDHISHSVTRGTKYWAPPRKQIIFSDHPMPDRKELLKKQNFRCAGCGMRVSPQYAHSFRYCTYLGKLHCTGCHRNQISATPAKILQAWDFKCYPVSVFAYRLLDQMSSYPLFYVPALNPALYIRSKSLLGARKKRLQLKYIKSFIRTCRFAVREQFYFESVPDYMTADVDNWSMTDFLDTHSGCLHRSIDDLICKCENHIYNCVLCTARGFLCEHCHCDGVIYPWDSRVERCDRCGSCFHKTCWKAIAQLCCRCQRIEKRQESDNVVV